MLKRLKPSNHGKKRWLKALLTGSSNLVVRFLMMGLGLISIPLTAKYLGAERFGVWLMLSTFLNWLNLVDFGLAHSLTNTLAIKDGNQDRKQAKIAVSSTFLLILIISIILCILFGLVNPWISWSKVFNIKSSLIQVELETTVLITFIIFLVKLPLSISRPIYNAYQEGYIYNIWQFIFSIISIFTLIISINSKASLHILVIAYFGVSLCADVFAILYVFFIHRPWLKPEVQLFCLDEAWSLLKLGSQFWFAQIAAIILLQTDLILVAQLFGAADAARYGVSLKLFGLISVVQISFLYPLWPAYTEALDKGDFKWISNTFKRSIILSLVWLITTNLIAIACTQSLVKTLIAQDTVPEFELLVSMSLTTLLIGIAQAIAMLFNGLGKVKIQAILGIPSGILNLIFSIFLSHFLGVSGITLGTSLTYIILIIIYTKILHKDKVIFAD